MIAEVKAGGFCASGLHAFCGRVLLQLQAAREMKLGKTPKSAENLAQDALVVLVQVQSFEAAKIPE